MTIFFNNDSEALIHTYLDHTTSSALAQEIEQAAGLMPAGSHTAIALTRALSSLATTVENSTHATAEQLRSVSSLLRTIRAGDEQLGSELGRGL